MAFEINREKQPSEVQQTKWTTTTGQQLEKNIFHLAITLGFPVDDRFDFKYDSCRTYGHQKTVTQLFENFDECTRFGCLHRKLPRRSVDQIGGANRHGY